MMSESSATTTFYRRRGKRLLDLVLAVPALAVAMPALALVSLGVAAALGRPVIFAQERPGLGGRTFWLYTFRTMTSERDSATGPTRPIHDAALDLSRVSIRGIITNRRARMESAGAMTVPQTDDQLDTRAE